MMPRKPINLPPPVGFVSQEEYDRLAAKVAAFTAAREAAEGATVRVTPTEFELLECPGNDCLRTDGFICGPDSCGIADGRADAPRILAALEPAPVNPEALIKAAEEIQRLRYVLEGVARAIDTGRNEPLVIWREQINIALEATADATIAAIRKKATP